MKYQSRSLRSPLCLWALARVCFLTVSLWSFGLHVSFSFHWSLQELWLSQSEQSLNPHSKFSTTYAPGPQILFCKRYLFFVTVIFLYFRSLRRPRARCMNMEQAALKPEKRDGKSFSGSLGVRDDGRARPVGPVHLHLCLQLGPCLIHTNMSSRHQWLQSLAAAVTCPHSFPSVLQKREVSSEKRREDSVISLGGGKRDRH